MVDVGLLGASGKPTPRQHDQCSPRCQRTLPASGRTRLSCGGVETRSDAGPATLAPATTESQEQVHFEQSTRSSMTSNQSPIEAGADS